MSGNPYDGHTLAEQLEQTTILLQDIAVKPHTVIADLGYRGVDADIGQVELVHRGKGKTLTREQRRWLRCRQAVEPAIGHLKNDNGMRRCWLKGSQGDAIHALLCAVGFNIARDCAQGAQGPFCAPDFAAAVAGSKRSGCRCAANIGSRGCGLSGK